MVPLIFNELSDFEMSSSSLEEAIFSKALSKLKASTGGCIKVPAIYSDSARLSYRDSKIQEQVLETLPMFGLELVDKEYPYEVRLTSGNS